MCNLYLHAVPSRQITMHKMAVCQIRHAFRHLMAELQEVSNGKALKKCHAQL